MATDDLQEFISNLLSEKIEASPVSLVNEVSPHFYTGWIRPDQALPAINSYLSPYRIKTSHLANNHLLKHPIIRVVLRSLHPTDIHLMYEACEQHIVENRSSPVTANYTNAGIESMVIEDVIPIEEVVSGAVVYRLDILIRIWKQKAYT